MLETRKGLPEPSEAFEDLVLNNRIYVDKTHYIYNIVNNFSFCHLARPVGFGKTCLLTAIEESLKGNKIFFQDYWIYTSDFEFKQYPILKFDFDYNYLTENKLINAKIKKLLLHRANDEYFNIKYKNNYDLFYKIILRLTDKYQKKAVILFDNLDLPIIDNLDNLSVLNANKASLNELISVINSLSSYIKLTFVTTTTDCFTLFTNYKHLYTKSLSFDPDFNGICGFTFDEICTYFQYYLEKSLRSLILKYKEFKTFTLANLREKILAFYGGYSWGKQEQIVNPASLINFFSSDSVFRHNYQIFGPNSYLATMIKRTPWEYLRPESLELTPSGPAESSPAGAVLFHAGYLTIDRGGPSG